MHVVVTQQLLVNGLSGLPMLIDSQLVEAFRKGTKTEEDASQKDLMLNEQYLKKVFFFLSFFEPFLNIKNVNHEINQKKNSLHFNE
jgi:hypothetical protein